MLHNKCKAALVLLVVSVVGLTLMFPSPVFSKDKQVFRLKIGMAKPIQAGKGFAIVPNIFVAEVKRRVPEETDYRVEFVEAYGGTVAKDGEVLEAVQMGLLDIGYVIFLFEPAKLFLHNFGFFVPFSCSDPVTVNGITRQLFNEFPIMSEVFEKNYNQKMLCSAASTSYQLITTFPVKTIEDLKGKKIAAGGPNLIAISPIGAIPVQSAIGEGYTSFKTGVYDGWLILDYIMAGLKWPEVAPYVTIVDLGSAPSVVLSINSKTWKKLPPEIQVIIQESATLMAEQGAREMKAEIEMVRGALKKMGATIYELPLEERTRWAARLPDVARAKAKEADAKGLPGTKLINRYIQLQKEAGYVFPRDWTVD